MNDDLPDGHDPSADPATRCSPSEDAAGSSQCRNAQSGHLDAAAPVPLPTDELRDGQERYAPPGVKCGSPSEATAGSGQFGVAKPGQPPTATPAPLGHNNPPLTELLDEELAPLQRQHDALIATATTAAIVDSDTAGKVVDLIAQCKAFEDDLEARRKAHIKPLRDAEQLINGRFNDLRHDVHLARVGTNDFGGLRGLLTAWDDHQIAVAAQAHAAAEADQQAKEDVAETARAHAIEAAAAGGRGAIEAELVAVGAARDARKAALITASIQAHPVRGHLGQVTRRREARFEIENPLLLADWMLQDHKLASGLLQALRTITGHHLRTLGVEAIDNGIVIPGLRAWTETGAANVRR